MFVIELPKDFGYKEGPCLPSFAEKVVKMDRRFPGLLRLLT
jgi:hypothetical protein